MLPSLSHLLFGVPRPQKTEVRHYRLEMEALEDRLALSAAVAPAAVVPEPQAPLAVLTQSPQPQTQPANLATSSALASVLGTLPNPLGNVPGAPGSTGTGSPLLASNPSLANVFSTSVAAATPGLALLSTTPDPAQIQAAQPDGVVPAASLLAASQLSLFSTPTTIFGANQVGVLSATSLTVVSEVNGGLLVTLQ